MRSALALIVTVVLFAPAAHAAGVEVHVADGRVDLKSGGAPLAEVLDSLAKGTGFKIERQGSVPNPAVPPLELTGRTPVEAVLTVLDGLGLSFAFAMDASGEKIETLILAGQAPATSPTAGPGRPVPMRPVPHPRPEVANPFIDEPEPEPPPDMEEMPEEGDMAVAAGVPGAPGAPPGTAPDDAPQDTGKKDNEPGIVGIRLPTGPPTPDVSP